MSKHIAEQFPLPHMPAADEPKEYRAASVINRTEVKRRLLLFAKDTRAHKFTRVSKDTLDTLESRVENMIRQHVTAAPSRGQTL